MKYLAYAGGLYERTNNPSDEEQPVNVLITKLFNHSQAEKVAYLMNDAYYAGERNAYTKVLGYVARQERK